ncbi:MAG: zinc-ribbon domain-containing protein, partial [Comamonas sp.]
MQVFNCDACGHLVFFDSLQCVHCGAQLAFLPDQLRVAAVQPLHYRLCAHRQ